MPTFRETNLASDDMRSDKVDTAKKSGISDYTRHLCESANSGEARD